jgi:fatty-acyl-CoA synthase
LIRCDCFYYSCLSIYLFIYTSYLFIRILRVDPQFRERPLRSADGLCILADYGEPGLLTSEISSASITTRFDGYSDSAATEKKILRDVFKHGDTFFNTGDLISRDKEGFFYWSDRVGDTFRWKGENVSTTEVENVLSSVPGFADITVYGVKVADNDGRAGMATIILKDGVNISDVNWDAYYKECSTNLTAYSRPVFLRIQDSAIQVTGTFKHQKSILVEDGFDPVKMKPGQHLFYYSQKDGKVTPLTPELYQQIATGVTKM